MATSPLKLEVVVIPVSDVNRAKEFYTQLGWRLDADFPFDNGFRVVQFELTQNQPLGLNDVHVGTQRNSSVRAPLQQT